MPGSVQGDQTFPGALKMSQIEAEARFFRRRKLVTDAIQTRGRSAAGLCGVGCIELSMKFSTCRFVASVCLHEVSCGSKHFCWHMGF